MGVKIILKDHPRKSLRMISLTIIKNHQTAADKSKTESTNFGNLKSSVFITSDNMMKNVKCLKLTGKAAHKCIIKVPEFFGAKTSCIKDYIKPIIREKIPNTWFYTLKKQPPQVFCKKSCS